MTSQKEPKVFDQTVLIDTREQAPYRFTQFTAGGQPLIVPTKRITLSAGDYSLEGYTDSIAVERKELSDLFNCCGHDRARFQQQIERLNDLGVGFVVVEGNELDIRTWQGPGARPSSVIGTIEAWQQRYPRVHWMLCSGRPEGEVRTFRILRRFAKDVREGKR